MPRARNIKPGFFTNEVLGEADPVYGLTFAGLWILADKSGRLEDRPKRIRAAIHPYRPDVEVSKILDWLMHESFIVRYQVNQGSYIQIIEWDEHQSPHHKEKPSKIPPLSEARLKHEPSMDQACVNESASTPLIPDSLIPDTGLSDIGKSDIVTSDDNENPWLAYLAKKHGYLNFQIHTGKNIELVADWTASEVTEAELDIAIQKSQSSTGEQHPPLAYLTKVLQSSRQTNANPPRLNGTARPDPMGARQVESTVMPREKQSEYEAGAIASLEKYRVTS